MPINVFRQSRCLNTSDSICDLFKWVCDKNDRNDKRNEKSYVRANDRGLWISCHSCHLCHWGMALFSRQTRQFLAPPLFLLASDANGQTSPVASSTATYLLIALTGKRLAKLHLATRVLAR